MILATLIEALRFGLFYGVVGAVMHRWQIRYAYSIPLIFLAAYIYAVLTNLLIPISFSGVNIFILLPAMCVFTLLVRKILSLLPIKIGLF